MSAQLVFFGVRRYCNRETPRLSIGETLCPTRGLSCTSFASRALFQKRNTGLCNEPAHLLAFLGLAFFLLFFFQRFLVVTQAHQRTVPGKATSSRLIRSSLSLATKATTSAGRDADVVVMMDPGPETRPRALVCLGYSSFYISTTCWKACKLVLIPRWKTEWMGHWEICGSFHNHSMVFSRLKSLFYVEKWSQHVQILPFVSDEERRTDILIKVSVLPSLSEKREWIRLQMIPTRASFWLNRSQHQKLALGGIILYQILSLNFLRQR